jgi:hypothetical protein
MQKGSMFVWVYKYRYWDAERQEQAVSRDMFTIDTIRTGLGVAIMESGMKVRLEEVDDHGRLKRWSVSAAKES